MSCTQINFNFCFDVPLLFLRKDKEMNELVTKLQNEILDLKAKLKDKDKELLQKQEEIEKIQKKHAKEIQNKDQQIQSEKVIFFQQLKMIFLSFCLKFKKFKMAWFDHTKSFVEV